MAVQMWRTLVQRERCWKQLRTPSGAYSRADRIFSTCHASCAEHGDTNGAICIANDAGLGAAHSTQGANATDL